MAPELNTEERRALRSKARVAVALALDALGGWAHRDDILTKALELGDFTSRELAAPIPRGRKSRYDRLVDEKISFALSDLKSEGALGNPERGIWCFADVQPDSVRQGGVKDTSAAALRAMPYRDYLRTPEWKQTRAAALLRAGYSCALDATHTDGLEVHHRTYERLGAELDSDLVVLCRACHRAHHQTFGRARRSAAAPGPVAPARLEAPSAGAPVAPEPNPTAGRGGRLRRLVSWRPRVERESRRFSGS